MDATTAALVQAAPVVASAPNATVLQAPRDPSTAEAKSDSVWPMLERGARVPAMPLMKATRPLECGHPNRPSIPLLHDCRCANESFASCFSIPAYRDGELVCARRHCGMLARRTHRPSPLPRCPHRLARLHWMMIYDVSAFAAVASHVPSAAEALVAATAPVVFEPMIWVAAVPWPPQLRRFSPMGVSPGTVSELMVLEVLL